MARDVESELETALTESWHPRAEKTLSWRGKDNAFSKTTRPGRRGRRYLRTMEDIGLQERFLPLLEGKGDGRLWRSVPGRRWYSDQRRPHFQLTGSRASPREATCKDTETPSRPSLMMMRRWLNELD
jgi:hypothetical protein